MEMMKSATLMDPVSKDGTRKKNWLDATGRKWPKCQLYGCGNQAEVGAHVYVKRRHHTFILPTCRRCNSNPLLDYDGDQTIWIPTKLNSIAYCCLG